MQKFQRVLMALGAALCVYGFVLVPDVSANCEPYRGCWVGCSCDIDENVAGLCMYSFSRNSCVCQQGGTAINDGDCAGAPLEDE